MFNSDLWRSLQSFLSFPKHLLLSRRAALLLLLIGVFLPLDFLGELAEEVWKNEGGFLWDVPILLAIHSTAQPQLDVFASTLTKLGVFWGVFPVAIAIALVLLIRRRWRFLVYFVTVLLGSIVINRTVKTLLHRVRPHLWESPTPEFDYGFPSGHAMSSMTLVATLVILTWGSRWCWLVLIAGDCLCCSLAGRDYTWGVHYPSDILAGWMASVAWATGASLLIRPHLSKQLLVNQR